MKDYVIGVDSGGTSTVAEAYNHLGESIAKEKTGFGNPLVNEELALENLIQAVQPLLDKYGISHCKGIVFGIAGMDTGDYKEKIREALAHLQTEIILMNDAWLAHYALLQGEDGCLIISGTGSIGIGRYKGKEARVGGWGHLLGDEGSGYAIAKHLIVNILQADDANRSFSALESKLLERYSFKNAIELSRFVYQSNKDQVAEMSAFIAKEADNQDKQAMDILIKAGQDLGQQALHLMHKLAVKEDIKIAVTGSVLTQNNLVFHAFQQEVLKGYENTHFIREERSNTIGAYYYFKK